MSNQPARAPRVDAQAPRERVRRYRQRTLLDLAPDPTPTWLGTASMDANGRWNGDRLHTRRHAHAEVIFTLAPGNQTGTLFEATGSVTYAASGTGADCTLELLPTTLPVIGYLQFAPTLPSPAYLISGGATGLLDHKLSCRNKPPMVISMEAWPWLVVPFQAAPVDAAMIEGTMTVGDATYTWSFARNPLPVATRPRAVTG